MRIIILVSLLTLVLNVSYMVGSKTGGSKSKTENDGYYGNDWEKMDRDLEKESEKAKPDDKVKDQNKAKNLKKPGGGKR